MPNNTGVAPICNAKAVQPNFPQKIPLLPAFSAPSVDNLVETVRQLQQAIQIITSTQQPHNNTLPGFPATIGNAIGSGNAGFGRGGSSSSPQQPGDWRETSRVLQDVKVVNPDDDSQFVIVREIASLTFTNQTTGETLTWKRDG